MTDVRPTIEAYFAAMRQGPEVEEEMMALFTDDAVYDEPFTGADHPAVGRDAIRARLRAGWATPLPDMELDVLSIEVTGDTAVSTWECRSTAFEQPARGRDEYVLRDGRIASLRVTLDSDL